MITSKDTAAAIPSYFLLLDIAQAIPQITSFEIVRYQEPPLLQERCRNVPDAIMRAALELREETNFSFWDCILENQIRNPVCYDSIIREAVFHNESEESSILPVERLTENKIAGVVSPMSKSESVALSSKVTLKDGSVSHIPLLDFSCPYSVSNLPLVERAMDHLLDADFYTVNSGKSFHCFGLKLFDQERWRQFLAKALLLNPIIDARYVAHQLLHGKCKLRLSPTNRKPFQPTLLRRFRKVAE